MPKAADLCMRLVCLTNVMATMLTLAPSSVKGDEVLSPAAQRGFVIVRTNCSRCSTIGKVGDSPLPIALVCASAMPSKISKNRWPGIVTGHRRCPNFEFDPGQVGDIIAYLKSLER